MAKPNLSLEEGTELSSQLTLLVAKRDKLVSDYDALMSRIEADKREINRLESLRVDVDAKTQESINLNKEIKTFEDSIQKKQQQLTEGGWVIPVPERKARNIATRI